jgi:hypothetical protein
MDFIKAGVILTIMAEVHLETPVVYSLENCFLSQLECV